MYGKYDSHIKMEGLNLSCEESASVPCPRCDDRDTRNPHLSITRTSDGLVFNCYRAGCGLKGFISSLPSEQQRQGVKSDFTPKPFNGRTTELGVMGSSFLRDKYDIKSSEIYINRIKHIVGRRGLLMPLLDWQGAEFGHTTKYFDGHKAIHYITRKTSKLHFPVVHDKHTTAVVVEDVLSGIRCCRFARGVVLLGTNLNNDMVEDIIKAKVHNVIVALDPDATAKAMAHKKRYGLFFQSFRGAPLSADPKDMTDKQLIKELDLP